MQKAILEYTENVVDLPENLVDTTKGSHIDHSKPASQLDEIAQSIESTSEDVTRCAEKADYPDSQWEREHYILTALSHIEEMEKLIANFKNLAALEMKKAG